MGSTEIICEDYIPQKQTSPASISENSVYIWVVRISLHLDALSGLNHMLSKEELTRSTNYRLLKDTQSFVIRQGILRCLLAKYTRFKPREIEFATGPNRKPVLKAAGHPVYFNVSHSTDLALIALASSEVGIDVEQVNYDFEYYDILKNAFSSNEISIIESNQNPRKLFFSFWTRKEAVLKATSKGLDDHLALIPCLDGKQMLDTELLGNNNSWTIRSFSPDEFYEASIAHQTGLQVKLIDFLPEDLISL
ncbi:MAG: 4'-phosphopantetheinyl transferase superfamily protein [Phormidesmis sp. FL-bin-119]|nr:4'-phosphopantetheinyl transferase superfamily protein [Pedobacter sp.]